VNLGRWRVSVMRATWLIKVILLNRLASGRVCPASFDLWR